MICIYLWAAYTRFLWLYKILVFRALWFFLHNLTPFVLVMLPNFLSPAWAAAEFWDFTKAAEGYMKKDELRFLRNFM